MLKHYFRTLRDSRKIPFRIVVSSSGLFLNYLNISYVSTISAQLSVGSSRSKEMGLRRLEHTALAPTVFNIVL